DVHGYALLCGQPRNGRGGLWFAPLDVPMPSVLLVCAFARRNAPAAKVLCLTPPSAAPVLVRARWLLSGGEMSSICVSDPPHRHVWRRAESFVKRYLFPAVED